MLYVRIGRIYQTQLEIHNLDKALEYYDLAIASDDKVVTNEGNQAHLYKGDIYLSQLDKYSAQTALAEFERALELDPDSYWALVDIGRLISGK